MARIAGGWAIIMETNTILLTIKGDRVSVRRKLLLKIGQEEAGTGTKKQASRYIYRVEKTRDGYWVELHRPAFLNKGIDFTVRIPGVQFNESKAKHWRHVPRHKDIASILRALKSKHGTAKYAMISKAISDIYKCQDRKRLPNMRVEYLSQSLHVDVALLSLKWLFIEQDLTYWNFSGRAKLFEELQKQGLVP